MAVYYREKRLPLAPPGGLARCLGERGQTPVRDLEYAPLAQP
ncbi:hypothetical protein QYE77_14725 (plasmid) [Thermanaerothrix sp. 4228-RoL]|uniref:Uncharacterized protein n=1 Tax=Thermanaerothrix solaris TaxID=3058434 RepID=A0ABU3NRP8_9CHLR|nr:hypothetical protein [Thermanaerothrix sp. 4228-RoL]MDT8899516.1 hypothetical protein [Thermanaerothrix sp. 4228-RoL]